MELAFLGKKKMAGKKDEVPPTVDLGLGETPCQLFGAEKWRERKQ
jgi:hypothetical protein